MKKLCILALVLGIVLIVPCLAFGSSHQERIIGHWVPVTAQTNQFFLGSWTDTEQPEGRFSIEFTRDDMVILRVGGLTMQERFFQESIEGDLASLKNSDSYINEDWLKQLSESIMFPTAYYIKDNTLIIGVRMSEGDEGVEMGSAPLSFKGDSMYLDKHEFRLVQEGEDLTDMSVLKDIP